MKDMRRLAYALGAPRTTIKFEDGTVIELDLHNGFKFLSSMIKEGWELAFKEMENR